MIKINNVDVEAIQEFLDAHSIDAAVRVKNGCLEVEDFTHEEEHIWHFSKKADTPWYIEEWSIEDLRSIMENHNIPVIEENIQLALLAVEGIFDDLSERNEKLEARIIKIFTEV